MVIYKVLRIAFCVLTALCIKINTCNAQDITCGELAEYVTSNYDSRDLTTCFNSSMLVKVEYYRLDDHGFVIAYIKSGDYDFTGTPYIFCGVSIYTWSNFKTSGFTNSWGKAFHQYIMNHKCNCK